MVGRQSREIVTMVVVKLALTERTRKIRKGQERLKGRDPRRIGKWAAMRRI